MNLELKLKTAWKLAKAKENAAKADRLAIEEEIYILYQDELKPEGTNKVGPFKIVTGFNRSWDQSKLEKLEGLIQPELFPFKEVYKEDLKLTRAIQKANPDAWDALSQALTLKPKKPSFSVMED